MRVSVLKPGLLVALSTRVVGGVNYQRNDIEADHTTEGGARVARWETLRRIPDPAEFERATEARGRARSIVSGACCMSSFGLLCPDENASALNDAIDEARKIAEAHNKDAALTRVEVFVLVGHIAADDAEAVRGIVSEVRELLDQMKAGIAGGDSASIREAANKARELGGMLSDDVAAKVNAAIAEARSAARALIKRVEKAGEAAADVVKDCTVAKIEAARFAFLDFDGGTVTHEAPAARPVELAPARDEPGAMMALPFRDAEV